MTTTEQPALLDMEEMLTAGITPRQLHYWATKGWLRPVVKDSRGTGNRRMWPPVEQDVARLMLRLTAAGLAVDVAAATARVAVEHDQTDVTLADGITLSVREVE